MCSVSDIALTIPVEANLKNQNNQKKIVQFPRFYEDELKKCVSNWRKHAGWLKNIPIYLLCATGNDISEETLNEISMFDVHYISERDELTDFFSSGFLNLPYCGQYFDEIEPLKEKIHIRIDLDMNCCNEIPRDLVEIAYDRPVIGQYDKDSIKDQRTSFPETLPFDTGFMITNTDYHFNKTWFQLCFDDYILKSIAWNSIKEVLGDYYLEEFVVDYINHNKLFKIEAVQKYQYGEGYASIDTFTDDEIDDILFLHEHIYVDNKFPWGYDSARERMKYLKRKNLSKRV